MTGDLLRQGIGMVRLDDGETADGRLECFFLNDCGHFNAKQGTWLSREYDAVKLYCSDCDELTLVVTSHCVASIGPCWVAFTLE